MYIYNIYVHYLKLLVKKIDYINFFGQNCKCKKNSKNMYYYMFL